MDKLHSDLDWSRVQAFLAVAETGSLSAAARQLGQSQPTLGRKIRSIEEALGAALFVRQPRGLSLSEAGTALLKPARAMQEAANEMLLTAAGRAQQMEGTVRVTASITVSFHMLPKIIAEIRVQEPRIQIELVPSDTSENLLFREADIALRMYRPTQLDVVTKHLGDMHLGIFAARSYLKDRPLPSSMDEVLALDMVGYDADESIIRGLREYGYEAERDWFALRCDNHNINAELVRAGCGVGFAPILIARDDPELVQLLPQAALPVLPIWLTAHEAMRQTPRIRRVWDLLSEHVTPLLDHAPHAA